MEIATPRKRKSEKLSSEERKQFNKYVESFDVKTDCAEALNISRVTLDRMMFKGSGRPETIAIIREALKATA